MRNKTKPAKGAELDFVDDQTAALLLNTPSNAKVLLWVLVIFFVLATFWASWAQIDKVTVGQGKVVPSSQIQIVQSLEGGLVKSILVKEGQQVKKGQQLLLIDDTLFQSNFREKEQQVTNLKASTQQFRAAVNSVVINHDVDPTDIVNSIKIDQSTLTFDDEFQQAYPSLVARRQAEYLQDLSNLSNQLSVLRQQITQKQQDLIEVKARIRNLQSTFDLTQKEYNLTKPLADEGVVPEVELLKLQRQLNESRKELTSSQLKVPLLEAAVREAALARVDAALKFRTEQQQKLNQAQDELSSLTESTVGLQDRVKRTVITSPVTGTISKLNINTIGGVIQPGKDIVEIVPTEDSLLVEARISPKDIAFLHPNLRAIVKFTAYDFTQFGGLQGELEHISADTSQDEDGNSFYIVRIRTDKSGFGNEQELPIIPGMTASVDILTGKRTVLEYLTKPILNAKSNALKE
ncbi:MULTISPECIES: HlyD family type I secretion periplasmic adaptor subunit [unclassified Vibrio]|uniref:Membrane fusion protein (MFP) family protein n=1 Tax=Vibrio sp. HB236076 TaxID=3232307 RepID=A0AB39HIS2_9VIBR|nr:HlyD family type I secretion periplasmic adaptor subunit [Vibrio sp. HB161653]MDP5252589.1 HlyD family type I secretion periplasmic adaptor subunit [Vibrio sp. HB161653]